MFNPESSILLLDNYSDCPRNNWESIQDQQGRHRPNLRSINARSVWDALRNSLSPLGTPRERSPLFDGLIFRWPHRNINPNHMFNMFNAQHDIHLSDCHGDRELPFSYFSGRDYTCSLLKSRVFPRSFENHRWSFFNFANFSFLSTFIKVLLQL
jgi:hypothetical protein